MSHEDKHPNAIINCAAYREGRRVADVAINDICEVLQESEQFVWIGLHEPSEETLLQVQNAFGLHELAIEDAHRAHQRPKIETYGDTLFIALRTAQMDASHQHVEFGETHFFVGENFLVSVRHGSSIPYRGVRLRCEEKPLLLKKGPAFALYAVMDSIVDQYFPVVNDLEQQLEAIEEKIFDQPPSRATTTHIYQLKRSLLEVKRAIWPVVDICNRLMRFDLDLISDDMRIYFRDIYDHAVRINEMVDNTRDLLGTALEANFSLISIAQSEVGKKFAGWAAIIGMPSMIAAIYGMNFHFMPGINSQYGFEFVVAITLCSCFGLYLFFRRLGWL